MALPPLQLSGQGTAESGFSGRDFFGGTINGPGASSSTGGGLSDVAKQVIIGVLIAVAVAFIVKGRK